MRLALRGGGFSAYGKGAKAIPDVAPAANGFNFAKAHARQCDGQVHYFNDHNSDEYQYFLARVDEIFTAMHSMDLPADFIVCPLMHHFHPGSGMHIELYSLHYAQLRPVAMAFVPPSDVVHDPDAYVNYKIDQKHYVLAPNGNHYTVLDTRVLSSTFQLLVVTPNNPCAFKWTLPNRTTNDKRKSVFIDASCDLPAALLTIGFPPKHYDGPNQRTVRVQFGEMIDDVFVPHSTEREGTVYVYNEQDGAQYTDIANYSKWPKATVAPPSTPPPTPVSGAAFVGGEAADDDREPAEPGEKVATTNWIYEIVDGCLCEVKGSSKDPRTSRLCNFTIEKVLAVYYYKTILNDNAPCYCVLVKYLNPDGDGSEEYLDLRTANNRSSTASVVRVEVLLQLYAFKNTYDFRSKFTEACPQLMAPLLTVEKLMDYMLDLGPLPSPTRIVTNFGRQGKSDLFVLGNVCFQDGRFIDFEEAGVHVLEKFFTSVTTMHAPISVSDFPYAYAIEQSWVRYIIYFSYHKLTSPVVFRNNYRASFLYFAASTMMYHSSLLWTSPGIRRAVPTHIAISSQGNTGKTYTLNATNALAGFHDRGCWQGKSIVSTRTATHSGHRQWGQGCARCFMRTGLSLSCQWRAFSEGVTHSRLLGRLSVLMPFL